MKPDTRIRPTHQTLFLVFGLGIVGAAMVIVACGPPTTPTTRIGCWATEVVEFSTEGSATDYSAANVIGVADSLDWTAPHCSDSSLAWSPLERDAGPEYITTKYEAPIVVDKVRVYVNFGPGVTRLATLTNTQDPSVPVLSFAVDGAFQGPGQACGILNIDIDMSDGFEFTRDKYDQVRLELDTTQVTGWNEYDAVQLAGQVEGGLSNAPSTCEEFVPTPVPTPTPQPTPTP